jgi:hypothetical protein
MKIIQGSSLLDSDPYPDLYWIRPQHRQQQNRKPDTNMKIIQGNSVFDPDPYLDRIRIKDGKNQPTKIEKKVDKFNFLKCLMFSFKS